VLDTLCISRISSQCCRLLDPSHREAPVWWGPRAQVVTCSGSWQL
jgi:hypothetical protein